MLNDTDPFETVLASLSLLIVGRPLAETLAHIAELAQDGIEAADYAAITTIRNGKPETTVATDPMITEIDSAQYDADAGPCLDAYRHGKAFRIESTEADDHPWPEFGNAAAARGVHSTLSWPLMAGPDGIGALNLYSREHSAFTDDDELKARRFAEPAAVILTNAQLLWDARNLAENLELALANRAVIEQAKGMLMGQRGLDADAAFAVLRRASQRENVKLRDIAQRLVDQAPERHDQQPDAPG